MHIANRHFKPTLAGTVATLLLLPLLLSLGAWQLRRAEEKRVLLNQYALGATTTQQLTSNSAAQLPLLQAVEATGRFDPTRQILLDNMPSSRHVDASGRASGGLPGYHVVTPLLLDDGYIVLVNRGWAPLGSTREQLPAIDISATHRSLRGAISDLQRPGIRLGSISSNKPNWPLVLNYPTITDLRALYGEKLLPRIILLDSNEPDGFARDWSTRYTFGDFGPDKHTGYAIQWFALAFTLLLIYVVVGLKRIPPPDIH